MHLYLQDLKIEFTAKGRGEDLLFIHGGTVSYRIHKMFLTELAKHFKVWAISLPGAGKSSKLPKDWTFNDYKYIVKSFVEDKEIKPLILGHSMGGAIAADGYIHFRKLFKQLVIFAPAIVTPDDAFLDVLKVIKSGLLSIIKGPDFARKDVIINCRNHLLDMIRISQLYSNIKLLEKIEKIDDEVLIFWGKKDKIIPIENMDHIKNHLRNYKLIKFDDNHSFLTRRRGEVVENMQKWLKVVQLSSEIGKKKE